MARRIIRPSTQAADDILAVVSMPIDPLSPWAQRLTGGLAASDLRAESLAKELRPDQLNWRPTPGAWSIGQCLLHLHMMNEVYLPPISVALKEQQRSPVSEITLSRFSRWFIRNYIAPNPGGTRARAPRRTAPATQVDPSILDTFVRGNLTAREIIAKASAYDVNRIRFKNPFIPLLRFTVGTGLEIIVQHQGRHLLQAENVRQSAGFPRISHFC